MRQIKRRSKEVIPALLDRSLTPESPAYEDITADKEALKSELNSIRELTLSKAGRKRSLSESKSTADVNTKRVRYSQRMEESKNKPAPEVSQTMATSLPVEKRKKKRDEESAENEGLTLEERLRKDYMTKDFHYTHLYPDYPIKKEYVCRLCFRPTNLQKCRGCNGYFHDECVSKIKNGVPVPSLQRGPIGRHKTKKGKHRNSMSRSSISSVKTEESPEPMDVQETDHQIQSSIVVDFICCSCDTNSNKTCFICKVKLEDGLTVECSYKGCLRHYHKACLVKFPQTSVKTDERIICPYHKCHTCFASDNVSFFPESKLVMCVLCPTSYHYNDIHCIPAGTEWLSTTQIICQNHALRPASKANVNVNWCFICARGGDLICCESCPGAFHLTCANEKEVPQGKYTCDNCLAGHRPLYNQLVWAKMSIYRYWPAIVLPPTVVPLNMIDTFHYPSDFCVKFFGTRDCAWLGRDRVFVYDENDNRRTKETQKSLDAAFNKAMDEVKIVHRMLQEEKCESQQKYITHKMKPDPYDKIKTNRAVPPIKLEMDMEAAELLSFECACKATDIDPCGYTSQCWNRSSKQECDPATCPAGETCQNQMFMKKIYPQVQERNTLSRGWGLFAQEDIREGTFVIEYVGEVINVKEMERRMALKRVKSDPNYYFMDLKGGLIIDADEKGNLARFINHSCMPNCQTERWQVGRTVRIGIFALKNIYKVNFVFLNIWLNKVFISWLASSLK